MTADPGDPDGASADGRAADGPSGDDRSGDNRSGNGQFGLPPANAPENRLAEGLEAGDDSAGRARPKKAPNAFRTISEVADDLHIPQHVLRFWETKFHQVKPMKRGGGRRYYRPDDIALLRRISDLLYIQGYTIKGVQRLLREGGGRLSEDIPPAPADERAAAEAEHDDIHRQAPLIPGLDLTPVATPAEVAPAPRMLARRRPDPEAERLRAVLVETLAELEAIRELLG
jgi:DNA-binding transcriptional MerR regulator